MDIPILDISELDDFNKAHHRKPEVTKFIYNVSWKNQEHYTIQDYSAHTPKKIIEKDPNSPFRGLKIVEFNPTELCNRTCHFCPRHDPEVYPNLNLHLDPNTVQNVVDDLVKQIKEIKDDKTKIDGQEIKEIITVNGVRFSFEDGSWGLIRASSNKPSLVVVTESPTSDERKLNIFKFIDKTLMKTGKIGEYDQKI